MIHEFVRALAFTALTAVASAQTGDMLGVSFDGSAYRIDSQTGQATLLGPTGFGGLNSLARTDDGRFLSTTSSLLQIPTRLVSIDPTTGAGYLVAVLTGITPNGCTATAIDHNTMYYVAYDALISRWYLWTIDLTTLQPTFVTGPLYLGVQSLDIGPDRRFYTTISADRLFWFDPIQGSSYELQSVSTPTPANIQTLAFSPSGELFGMGNQLFRIDRVTTHATPVGPPSNHDIRGLAFLAPTPPRVMTGYCAPNSNTLGCRSYIEFSGAAPSMSDPAPCWLTTRQVVDHKSGLLLYSYGLTALPFGFGGSCLRTPLHRTPLQNSGGNAGPSSCTGSFAFDFNAWIQSHADPSLTVGRRVYAQYWYRDAVFNIYSDAFGFSIRP